MTPQQLALQPNTPFERLEELAGLYADEVMQNPIFQNPKKRHGKWTGLYNEARLQRANQTIRASIELAEPNALRFWLCSCLEPALPIYEKVFPGDFRLRTALKEVRSVAEGKAKSVRLFHAYNWAFDAEHEAKARYFEVLEECEKYHDFLERHVYVKESAMFSAYQIAEAVGYATSTDEKLSLKAPITTHITEGPHIVARCLALMSIFDGRKLPRLLSEETFDERAARMCIIAEQQALQLAGLVGAVGEPEKVLRELSLYRREELHELYQKEEKERDHRCALRAINDGAPMSCFRAHLIDPTEILPSDRALDPNTPPEELLALAPECHKQVAQNPALPSIEKKLPAIGKQIREILQREDDFDKMKREASNLSWFQLTCWITGSAMSAMVEHIPNQKSVWPVQMLLVSVSCAAGQIDKSKLRAHMAMNLAILKELEGKPKKTARAVRFEKALEAAIEAAQVALDGSYLTAMDSARLAAEASKNPAAMRKLQMQKIKYAKKHSTNFKKTYSNPKRLNSFTERKDFHR